MTVFEPTHGSRQKFTVTIKDENGVVIPGTSLAALTLTFYERSSGAIINGRNAQNILGTLAAPVNNCYVTAGGVLTWIMQPLDNAIQSPRVPVGGKERHVALFAWTYDADGKGYTEEFFDVTRLAKVS